MGFRVAAAAAVMGLAAVSATLAQDTGPISAKRMSDVVRVIASDGFEGRAPGTPGEDTTVAYLVDKLRAMGLEPGGDNGGWTQAVPMIRFE
ncbi:MAG TPA: peptidase M20, partial [Caulobacteraceae bacterium]|nr:peptidase M20 [Caulobacteraceae bacterium]